MTRVVGMIAAAILFGLSAVHVYWASGGRWGSDVASPKQGSKRAFEPSAAATLIVAGLLFAAGLVFLGRVGVWGAWLPHWIFIAGAWTLVLVFAGRVIGDLRWFGIFKRVKGTPFAWWDTRLFVPLCAMLSVAALLVAFDGH